MLRPSCREGGHSSLQKHKRVVVYRHWLPSFLRVFQIKHHLPASGECHCKLDIVLGSNLSQLQLLFQRREEAWTTLQRRSQLYKYVCLCGQYRGPCESHISHPTRGLLCSCASIPNLCALRLLSLSNIMKKKPLPSVTIHSH
jgi:hypothetical protein